MIVNDIKVKIVLTFMKMIGHSTISLSTARQKNPEDADG